MPNIPPASPNTPLVGFSLPDGASRVYYLSPQSDVISPLYDVIELAWIGSSWVSNNITSLAGASLVSSINALAGFSLPDGASRVYCFDNQNHVIELAWVGHWVRNDITAATADVAPAIHSPLVAFCLPNGDSRVYCLSPQYNIVELAWVGPSWATTTISGASLVSGINALAGFSLPDGASRVYCFDNQNHVIELAWVGHWVRNDLTASAGVVALYTENGSLVGFSLPDGASRVYFFNSQDLPAPDDNVMELAWIGHWVRNDISSLAGAFPVQPTFDPIGRSQLVGFSLPDGASRVYYLNNQVDIAEGGRNDVIELAWVGHWVSNNISSLASGDSAAYGSPLAGFSLPDGASRVYYLSAQNHVIELAWVGHWVSNDLMEIATPQ